MIDKRSFLIKHVAKIIYFWYEVRLSLVLYFRNVSHFKDFYSWTQTFRSFAKKTDSDSHSSNITQGSNPRKVSPSEFAIGTCTIQVSVYLAIHAINIKKYSKITFRNIDSFKYQGISKGKTSFTSWTQLVAMICWTGAKWFLILR